MTKQMSKNGAKGAVRVEEDALGDVEVPSEHLWGAQSQLARWPQTFQFSGDRSSPCRTIDVFLPGLHSSKFHKCTWGRLQISDLKALK